MNPKGILQVPDDNWIQRKRRMRKYSKNNNNA